VYFSPFWYVLPRKIWQPKICQPKIWQPWREQIGRNLAILATFSIKKTTWTKGRYKNLILFFVKCTISWKNEQKAMYLEPKY
jgi:hypothetical protein